MRCIASGVSCRMAALTVLFASGLSASGQILFQDQTASRFPAGVNSDYTNYLDVADIDNDGDFDILWANGGNFTTEGPDQVQRIWINNGTGTFTDESAARGAVSGNYRGVASGDIDHDGDLDLLWAQDFNKLPALMINNGLGFFTNETATRLPNITLGSSRGQFADIDNDGDLDIYINSGGGSRWGCGQNRVYINNGSGFYTDETASRHPIGNLCEPQDVIFGDVDNDFDIDVRTGSTGNNQSRLYINNGTGVFTTKSTPSDQNCYSYDFGDIDGDGDLDLIGANAGSGNAELLLRNSDGLGTYVNASGNLSPNPGVDDNDSKFFDYDMDGDMDLIVARLGGSAERIYNNNGLGIFTEITGKISPVGDATLGIQVADVTGDNRMDIITAQGESGSFTNRIFVQLTTGVTDTRAPRIIKMEQVPDTQDGSGSFVVRANILDDISSDRHFFAESVVLHYAVNGGEEQTVPMTHSGGQVFRGVIEGPVEGTVDYFVSATDLAGNTGTGTSLSFEVLTFEIVSSDPPSNSIDARQPSDVDGSNVTGLATLELTFSGAADALTAGDFAVSEEGGDGNAPSVILVALTGDNSVQLFLSGPIEPGAWTTVTHVESDSSVRFGYLPGDVNADKISSAPDVLALIDSLNGITSLPIYSTDIDRSGEAGAPDVLREIDLLNGAGAYDVWLGQTLP